MENKQMRVSQEELDLIRSTFKGNEKLLKALRKFFLPTITGDEPIGQTVDLWMSTPIKDLTPEQAYHQLIARNFIIGHIEAQLSQLEVIAEQNVKKEIPKTTR